jgi:hypothetical protein
VGLLAVQEAEGASTAPSCWTEVVGEGDAVAALVCKCLRGWVALYSTSHCL